MSAKKEPLGFCTNAAAKNSGAAYLALYLVEKKIKFYRKMGDMLTERLLSEIRNEQQRGDPFGRSSSAEFYPPQGEQDDGLSCLMIYFPSQYRFLHDKDITWYTTHNVQLLNHGNCPHLIDGHTELVEAEKTIFDDF